VTTRISLHCIRKQNWTLPTIILLNLTPHSQTDGLAKNLRAATLDIVFANRCTSAAQRYILVH